MPKDLADRIIMFCVIGLLAWAIIVLPAMQGAFTSRSYPAHAPAAQQAADNTEADKPWLTKDAAGFFTFALFVVGSIQVGLFLWQLWLIRESLDDAKIAAEAAKEAADAAKDGAKATRDSADIAKISMIASDRAYVHYAGCRWISHRREENGTIFWRIRPHWTNAGNTPTRGLSVYIHYELLDAELSDDYVFLPIEHPRIPAQIPAKGTIESLWRDVDGSDLLEVKKGRKFLYVWGVATYRDVFPHTPERITKFCVFAATVTGDPTAYYDATNNIVEIAFTGYRRHNCADEDCD